jgi:hypothetical protein
MIFLTCHSTEPFPFCHCEERSDAAIQPASLRSQGNRLDCHVGTSSLLAMTTSVARTSTSMTTRVGQGIPFRSQSSPCLGVIPHLSLRGAKRRGNPAGIATFPGNRLDCHVGTSSLLAMTTSVAQASTSKTTSVARASTFMATSVECTSFQPQFSPRLGVDVRNQF